MSFGWGGGSSLLLQSTSQPGLSELLPGVLHTVANSQEAELNCQTEQFRAVFTFFAFDPNYNYQGGEARQLPRTQDWVCGRGKQVGPLFSRESFLKFLFI